MSKLPFVPGMIIKKRHWSERQSFFNFILFFIGLILFFILIATLSVINDVASNECIKISDKACIKEINQPQYQTLTYRLLGLLGLYFLLIIFISYFNSSTYSLTINTQEEYDKHYPKYISGAKQREFIISSLKEIKDLQTKILDINKKKEVQDGKVK